MKFLGMKWVLLAFALCPNTFSQTSDATARQGQADHASEAVFFTRGEIQEAIREAPQSGVKDAALRVLSIGDEYNLGVSVVRRARVGGKTLPDALEHHAITEVYHVIEGCGSLTTGGKLANPKDLPKDDPEVLGVIGPTAQGTAIEGGSTRRIAAGDVVVIPVHTAHGFAEICPEGISYVLVRVDGGRVLRTK